MRVQGRIDFYTRALRSEIDRIATFSYDPSDNYGNPISEIYIFGCGGVGSWIGLFIAISHPVNRLVLVDPDLVEEHNLYRTPFRNKDVGKNKAVALAKVIKFINDKIEVIPLTDDEIAFKYITTCDLAFICVDNRDAVERITDVLQSKRVPRIYVNSDGIHGNVRRIMPKRSWNEDEGYIGYQARTPMVLLPSVIAFLQGLGILDNFVEYTIITQKGRLMLKSKEVG